MSIENQLINKKNIITIKDELTENIIELRSSNIEKYYNEVYILAKKNSYIIPIEFYNLDVDEIIYKQVLSNLIIYKVSISILKNSKYFNKIVLLSNTDIEQFNIFNYTLGVKNIILPILNINFSELVIYMEQYSQNFSIDNISKLIIMNNYLESDCKVFYHNKFDNMKESLYWTFNDNCLSSLNHNFIKRKIFFNTSRLKNKEIANDLNTFFKSQINIKSEDYIKDITNKKDYIDISSIDNYMIGSKPNISYNEFNKLFDSLDEKEQYFLFTNCMISKEYVHLAINNKHILKIMLPKINIYLLKYLLSYSWIMFYYEECISGCKTKINDTFIFDIETASLLPVFPFISSKPTENPYMPILVSQENLFSKDNVCGIPDYNTNNLLYRNGGICNLKEFKYRMNIFCSGNPYFDIFDNFDFKYYNAAISGSIVTACLQMNHPLMNILKDSKDIFNDYFNEFYVDADIDIMFKTNCNLNFICNVKELYKQICINIIKFKELKDHNTKLILNKVAYLFISEKFIKDNITTEKTKIKWIKKNINNQEVINMFTPFYEKIKQDKYNELINGLSEAEIDKLKNEFPDIYKILDVEFKIYINDKTKNDIDMVYTYKYKIISPHIKHQLELFKINSDDFFSHVSQFHLPCVRAYYNGNVYLTPSCISSHMTYMNIDYKYVSGSTDIIEIINKYRLRGFGTWLNEKEYNIMFKYNHSVQKWHTIFGFAIYKGSVSINNNIFHKKNKNKYHILELEEFDHNLSYYDILKIRYPNVKTNDIFNSLIVINKDGFITPLKKWIVNFSFDLI
jgi:hypothetical protein